MCHDVWFKNKIDRTLKASNKLTSDKCYCFGKPRICSLCLVRPAQTAPRAGTPGFRAPEVLLKYASQTQGNIYYSCCWNKKKQDVLRSMWIIIIDWRFIFKSAIDIWACGVMMLSILSGTQPFFRSPDDITALAEITAIFGSNAVQQCARKLGMLQFKMLVRYSNILSRIK